MTRPSYSDLVSGLTEDVDVRALWRERSARDRDFRRVRRAYRTLLATAVLLSVGSFVLYLLLSCFAPALMNVQVAGHVTLGLIVGLSQFVVMAATARFYVVHMRKRVDPIVDGFREADRHRAEQQQQNVVFDTGEFQAW